MSDGTVQHGHKHNDFFYDKDLIDIIDIYVDRDVHHLSLFSIDLNGKLYIQGKLGKHSLDNIVISKVINTTKYLIILSRDGNLFYVNLDYHSSYQLIAYPLKHLNITNIIDMIYYNKELLLLTSEGDIYIIDDVFNIEKQQISESINKIHINKGKTKFSSDEYYCNNVIALSEQVILYRSTFHDRLLNNMNKYWTYSNNIKINNLKLNIATSVGDTLIYYNGERIFIFNIKESNNKFVINIKNVVNLETREMMNYIMTSDGICRYFFHGNIYENKNKFKKIIIEEGEFYEVPISDLHVLKYKSFISKLSYLFGGKDKKSDTLYGAILTPDYLRSNIDPIKYFNTLSKTNDFVDVGQKSLILVTNDGEITVNQSIIGYSTVLSNMVLSFENTIDMKMNMQEYRSKEMINILTFYDKYKKVMVRNQLLEHETDDYFTNNGLDNYVELIKLANYLDFELYLYCFCGYLFRKALYMKDRDREKLFGYKYFCIPIIASSVLDWTSDIIWGDILSYYIYGNSKENIRKEFMRI